MNTLIINHIRKYYLGEKHGISQIRQLIAAYHTWNERRQNSPNSTGHGTHT